MGVNQIVSLNLELKYNDIQGWLRQMNEKVKFLFQQQKQLKKLGHQSVSKESFIQELEQNAVSVGIDQSHSRTGLPSLDSMMKAWKSGEENSGSFRSK